MASIRIPIITEDEYESFRGIGLTDQFPLDYVSFIEMLSAETNELCHGGIIPDYVNINFSGFIAWFGTGKTATHDDLIKYAASVIKSK